MCLVSCFVGFSLVQCVSVLNGFTGAGACSWRPVTTVTRDKCFTLAILIEGFHGFPQFPKAGYHFDEFNTAFFNILSNFSLITQPTIGLSTVRTVTASCET